MLKNDRNLKDSIFYAALYMRLSREDGDKEESDSIANQRRMLDGYINNKKDLMKYIEFVDDGFTGTNFDRPGFKGMIKEIEKGSINCVIVKDLSRFGRDYIDTGYYLERYFIDHDIRFISLNDNIDSLVSDYDMLMPVKNVFNSQYAKDISRKVQSSFKAKQHAGEFIGAFPSYGYCKDSHNKHRLVIDSYAASIVRRVFELYIQGSGKIKIAHILNEEGILCPSEYKKVCGYNYVNSKRLETTSYWTYPTVHRMLTNEMYLGNMVQGKTKRRMKGKAKTLDKEQWIIVKGTHEAIIEEETWNKVQCFLQKDTKQIDLNENISVFAGFLKCGDCKRALAKKYCYYSKKDQFEQRIPYYVCSGYTRYGKKICTPHKINYKELEVILIEDIKTIIESIGDLRILVDAQKKLTPNSSDLIKVEREQIVSELSKTLKLKKEIYEDYKENLLTKEEYLSYRNDYQKKEVMLKQKEKDLATKQEDSMKQDIFESPWIKKIISLKVIEELDRDILADMVSSIYVFEENRVKIVYNFSNELDNLFQSTIKMY